MNPLIEQLEELQDWKYEKWTETCWIEDSGKDETIIRKQLLTDETTDKEKELWNQIEVIIPELSDDELEYLDYHVLNSTTLDNAPILKELGKRGDVFAIADLCDVQWLQILSNQGNVRASWLLFELFDRGDEDHGIAVNKQLAKKYYDLVDPADRWYEFEP